MKKRWLASVAILLCILVGVGGFLYYQSLQTKQIDILEVESNEEIEKQMYANLGDAKFIHFSIDDFIDPFKDISENAQNYNSIFDNEKFAELKALNEKYDMKFSLYTFYENDDFNLSEMPSDFIEDFVENKEWLRFGFHSKNSTSDYSKDTEQLLKDFELVENELIRFTGGESNAEYLRIHFYKGNISDLLDLTNDNEALKGFFSADDKRMSYSLNEEETSYLYLHDYYVKDGVELLKTDIRLENLNSVAELQNSLSKEKNNLASVIFTHESVMMREDILEMINYIGEYTEKEDLIFK